jgi:hypothetical protein
MIISLISPQSHYLTPTHASAVLIVLLHSLSRPSFPKHTSCFAMMITPPPPPPLLLLATPAPAPAAAAAAAAATTAAAGYPSPSPCPCRRCYYCHRLTHVSIQTVLTHAVHCLFQFLI